MKPKHNFISKMTNNLPFWTTWLILYTFNGLLNKETDYPLEKIAWGKPTGCRHSISDFLLEFGHACKLYMYNIYIPFTA